MGALSSSPNHAALVQSGLRISGVISSCLYNVSILEFIAPACARARSKPSFCPLFIGVNGAFELKFDCDTTVSLFSA